MDNTITLPITKSRTAYIDIARGIGIILLVLGHIITGNSPIFNWIFSFHMPLFFFISGMTASEKQLNNFPAFVVKKLKSRVLAYFVITALGLIICMIIPQYRIDMITVIGWPTQLTHIFYLGTPQWLYIGQVWFLFALFWSELYFYGWYKLVGKRHIILQLAVVIIFIAIARNIWRIYPYLPHERVPLLTDVAFMGAACYILGFLTKRHRLSERLNTWVKLILIPIAFAINIYFGPHLNGYVNMVDLVFVNIFRYVISMIAGIAGIMLVSTFIQKLKPLQWIGRYSLPLFASHTFIIYLVREIVYWCTGTHYTMMGDVPNSLSFLITLAVLVLMVPIGLLYGFIEKKLKELKTKNQ